MAVALESRLRFDAVVIACDVLGQAYQDLARLAAEVGTNPTAVTNAGRASAIGLCWTIVDQMHAVRQLVMPPADREVGPIAKPFLQTTEVATALRNKMDHLSTNIRNLAEKKGERLPLFGAFAYLYSNPDPATGGYLITISSGAMHGADVFPTVRPAGVSFTTPVGLLELHAFDLLFPFSPAFAALQDFIAVNERRLEEQIRRLAEEEASNTGKSFDELMAHLGGGMILAAKFHFWSRSGDAGIVRGGVLGPLSGELTPAQSSSS